VNVFRKWVGYPELKRAVKDQTEFCIQHTILIEYKASGTQVIQELSVKRFTVRLHSVTSTIENGFAYIPEKAPWMAEYVHEMVVFPNGKYDDQVDSTSQALDWFKNSLMSHVYEVLDLLKREKERAMAQGQSSTIPASRPCAGRSGIMTQRIPGGVRCAQ